MKRGSVKNRVLDRYLGIPILYATSLLKRRRAKPDAIGRIGIMASPTLGDTLLNSGAVLDIRRHYPAAHIIYFAAKTSVAAVKLLPAVDEIVEIDLTKPVRTIRTMRSRNLDLMVDFTQWQRLTAFFSALSGAKYKIGFRSENQYRHWHYDVTVEHSSKIHEVENFRAILRALGIDPSSQPALTLPAEPKTKLTHSGDLVIFHPWASGDRSELREWPLENWIDLARELDEGDTFFYITGAPSERSKSESLSESLRRAGLSSSIFVGSDGLLSVALLLDRARLVVSVNTGVMHLAAVLGAPTISLNGPTATHRWGPVGRRVAAVEPHGGGGGFLNFGFEFEGKPTDTMSRIRVGDVLAAARTLTLQPSMHHLSTIASGHLGSLDG